MIFKEVQCLFANETYIWKWMLSQDQSLGTARNDGPHGLLKVRSIFPVTWSHYAAHPSFSCAHPSLDPTHWDYRQVLRLQAQASTRSVKSLTTEDAESPVSQISS